ncbi:MAG: NIPSNAP family protein [Verrucomicrobiota bacterium]
MNRRSALLLLPALILSFSAVRAAAAPADSRCYELRTYTASAGKLDALLSRFRDHTVALFKKHGMTNVGYWTPVDNRDRKLIYLLSFPSREARDASFKAFGEDPEWRAAFKESEKDGKLTDKIESRFLTATDFSPAAPVAAGGPARVYELRTYTTGPGNLPKLLDRFRNHTVDLFAKHGMKNFGYWTPSAGDPDADNTLIYLLAHDSEAAQAASFAAFRADPVWVAAKAASEKAAGGSLTVPDGVKSLTLIPTDFSAAK